MLKAIMLLSNFASASFGEVLRDYFGVPLPVLFDISVVGQAISLLCAVVLPECTHGQTDSSSDEDCAGDAGVMENSECHGSWIWRELVQDLRLSLQLQTVLWWTAWALLLNPVHGITMTYWQGLVRSKHILSDHNGAMLASTYLFAALFTLVSGSSSFIQGHADLFVICSMLAAGLLLLQVVRETEQLPIYLWLLLFQCLFEVTTAIATYQVGSEVSQFRGCSPRLPGRRLVRSPKSAVGRLSILFSATHVAAGLNESVILFLINGWPSVSLRFFSLGICLLACSFLLAIARIVQSCARLSLACLEPR